MLRELALAIRSPSRNVELLLLVASAAFLFVAWKAFDAAHFAMPASSDRVLAQVLITAVGGHIGLRLIAPRASGVTYAVALLLTAIGVTFVIRLAPDVAQTQANWITLGVILMLVTAGLSRRYELLREYKYTAALIAFALLVFTAIFGTTINGARLWVRVGGQLFQTTELIKLFFLVFLAGYLADEASVLSMPRLRFGGRTYSTLPYLIPLLLALMAAMAAFAVLRELGSIALLLLLSACSLYLATGRARYILVGAVIIGLTAVFGYYAFDYAQARIDVWLHPFATANSTGYQTVQSLFAIHAGGVTGTGLGMGDPQVIPAASTDYVFSAIAEELGLAGALGVVLLYVLFLFSGLRISLDIHESFGKLLTACCALLIAIQAAVIIAGNLRLIPTTGITLPFVSYGGSSLIVNFIIVGLMLGVSDAAARRQG
jgi:peptidoglycan glycosyltransferase